MIKKGKLNRFTFHISPHTYITRTQRDEVCFVMPEECPHKCGEPRRATAKSLVGCRHCLPKTMLARKRRIEHYYDWKDQILTIARRKGFEFPLSGSAVYFFIAMPKKWPKSTRDALHMTPHERSPDLSNLLKAYEDGLLNNDSVIWNYAGLGKYWVDTMYYDNSRMRDNKCGPGWIEVHMNLPVYNPKTGIYEQ